MGIPEEQLKTWAKGIQSSTYKDTYDSIYKAIKSYNDFPSDVKFDIYLQGSYANTTNIRANSDIDVVVELTTTFYRNLDDLTENEKQLYDADAVSATYLWEHFRLDVLDALCSYYHPYTVSEGKKTLKVEGKSGRLNADVVVCEQHRKYHSYNPYNKTNFTTGMTLFYPNESRWIVNYPKDHKQNGINKHRNTNQRYKSTIRMFKNAFKRLIERNFVDENVASSYFIESLLFNVPDEKFSRTLAGTYYETMKWLSSAELGRFDFQNKHLKLFGDLPDQWSIDKAEELIDQLIVLNDSWR